MNLSGVFPRLLAVLGIFAPVLYSQDGVEDTLRREIALPLRWDNVERCPEWAGGVAPEKRGLSRRHIVRLEPGSRTCVSIPAHETLRIVGEDGPIERDDLLIELSDGSGLLAEIFPAIGGKGRSLHVDPRRSRPMLAHLSRPQCAGGAISISLFTSRHVPPAPLAAYRTPIFPRVGGVRVRTAADAGAPAFREWKRGGGETVTLQGPGRYRLETRFLYPGKEAKLVQTYHVTVRDEERNRPVASLDFATSHDSSRVVLADGAARITGRLEAAFFTLPEQRRYRVSLETSAPVFARLLQLDDPGYLFPDLNAPGTSPMEAAASLHARGGRGTPWEISPESLLRTIRHPLRHDAGHLERVALRLARDNSQSEGGMMAAALLWNAGQPRRDYPGMRRRASEFRGFHTFYRNVLPEGDGFRKPMEAYVAARSLLPVGERGGELVVGEQHLDAGLMRLARGVFCFLPEGGGTAIYRFPKRHTATQVRILARWNGPGPTEFFLRIRGREETRRLRLLPGAAACPSATGPTRGEAALHFIPGGTLDAGFGFRRRNAPMVPAGIFEFAVGPEVEGIELFSAPDSIPLPVSVQVRGSDGFSMSEDEYFATAERAGPREVRFRLMMDCLSSDSPPGPGVSRERRELFNHWEPLRRYVRSRVRRLEGAVERLPEPLETDRWLSELDRLVEERETFLAEQLARVLYFQSGEKGTRKRAASVLREIASREIDGEHALALACAFLVKEPGEATATDLARCLRARGESGLALMLSLVIPPRETNRDLRLATAFLENWRHQFEAVLNESPDDPVSRQWKGLRCWKRGDREEALRQWEHAGAPGRRWLDHVEKTSRAREGTKRGEASGLVAWAESENDVPGRSVWKPLPPSCIGSFCSASTVSGIERGTHFTAWQASPDRPLELTIPSPRLLQIECRPLHAAGAISVREGWVEISGGQGGDVTLPVLGNYPSSGLAIVGHPGLVPGTAVSTVLPVDGWNETLRIRPDFGTVLVRVSRREPEVRTGGLPELTPETVARIRDRNEGAAPDPEHGSDRGGVVLVREDGSVIRECLGNPFSAPDTARGVRVTDEPGRLPGVELEVPSPGLREAIARMTRYLRDVQSGDDSAVKTAIASAAAEESNYPMTPELERIRAAVLRGTFWEPLLAAERSAGFRETETRGWIPESPVLLSRMRLIPRLGPGEQLLSGTDTAVASIANREGNRINLRLSLAALPFLKEHPLRARVRIGDEPPVDLVLSRETGEKTITREVPAGRTSVRIEILENTPNQYLRFELQAEKEAELFERKTTRNWFVATRDEPLQVGIDGPAWVRIDRYDGGDIGSEYRHVTGEIGRFTFTPGDGESERLYRIHVLRFDPGAPHLPSSHFTRDTVPVTGPLGRQDWPEPAGRVAVEDAFSPGGQEDGTTTIEIAYHSRRATEEDRIGGDGPEQFGEGKVTYRYYDESKRSYFATSLLGRIRETGEPVYGLERDWYVAPLDNPFGYSFSGSLFEQDGEWSLRGRGRLFLTQVLSPRVQHTPSLSLFGRVLTLEDAGAVPGRIDRDIFTDFKGDHGIGLRAAEQIVFSPWRDTRLHAGAGLGTNEDFNLFDPDSINYRFGADQFLGPLRLGAEFRGYRYFEDEDRSATVSRHRLEIEAAVEGWTTGQQRIEIGGQWTHFLEENENSFYLFGRLHLSEGRLFRDFRPGGIPFEGLRERRIPHSRNNRIRSIDLQEERQGR